MELDAEGHPGQAGFQIHLFWVLLKLSASRSQGRPHWPCEGGWEGGELSCVRTLGITSFKTPALSHLPPPSSPPACQICAASGEEKSQHPNKGQNLIPVLQVGDIEVQTVSPVPKMI